jgi:hypothetical protein
VRPEPQVLLSLRTMPYSVLGSLASGRRRRGPSAITPYHLLFSYGFRYITEWFDGMTDRPRTGLALLSMAAGHARCGACCALTVGGAARDTSDCRIRQTAAESDRKPGVERLSFTAE